MLIAGNRCKRNGNGFHLVIICDETGIFDAFSLILGKLVGRENAFLSLIYAVPGKNLHPLFVKELSILEQRYSGDLIVHILKIDAASHRSKQELIEATINSNTFPVMKFSVFGNAEFVDYVSGVLGFLEVEAAMIHSKVI